MDFDRSVSKLKKEQEKRRAEAVRKAERERKAQEEAKKQHALIQHAVETRRREQLEKEEHDRLAAEEERRITAGISYSEAFLPFEVEGEGDKITLPPSALESLSKQDALAQGPMLFQLVLIPRSATATAGAGGAAAGGGGGGKGGLPPGARTTHAGVLEFSAEEGTVGLPLKVRKSLLGGIGAAATATAAAGGAAEGKEEGGGGSWAGAGCMVRVKYIRLEKGTYAKFQPRTGGLSQVPELKGMLEMNLLKHSTLTKGDLLQVWFRGKCFDLKVVELEPLEAMQAVTVIDTDLTVDVDVPEEQVEKEKEEQGGKEGGRTPRGGGGGQSLGGAGAGMGKQISPPRTLGESTGGTVGGGGGGGKTVGSSGTGTTSSSSSSSSSTGGPMRSATSAEIVVPEDSERAIMRYMRMNALGEEPGENEEGVISLVVRKPDGSMESRRFRKGQPFQDVFRFVDATSISEEEESYRLVTRFPRRVFSVAETAGQSVGEVLGAGTGKKEMLMYESC